jgi:hypothetical protein
MKKLSNILKLELNYKNGKLIFQEINSIKIDYFNKSRILIESVFIIK